MANIPLQPLQNITQQCEFSVMITLYNMYYKEFRNVKCIERAKTIKELLVEAFVILIRSFDC